MDTTKTTRRSTRALLAGAAVMATVALASPAGAAQPSGDTSRIGEAELYVEEMRFHYDASSARLDDIDGGSQDVRHSPSIQVNSWNWADSAPKK